MSVLTKVHYDVWGSVTDQKIIVKLIFGIQLFGDILWIRWLFSFHILSIDNFLTGPF